MLRAVHFSSGLKPHGFPPLRATWRDMRIDRRELDDFLRLTGLRGGDSVPLLYFQAAAFPLQMALVTHPAFPLPIWGALQIRNHLLQHRPIDADAAFDLQTRVAGQRMLEKGAEADLHTTVHAGGTLLWEGLTTFYYRGRHGAPGAPSPLASAPEVGDAVLARWHAASGAGRRFARLTGDYNGIHLFPWYARMLGFQRAFHHPQLVLGQCMAHLPAADAASAQRLDAWFKGPVYYETDVALRASIEAGGARFALVPSGESRPAVLGRWSACQAAERLVEQAAH
jgi:acyl dehydratase